MSLSENDSLLRIALVIEYHGADFHGWQLQKKPAVPTVAGLLTEALSKIANHPVHLYCAGRTDAGVHATHQVVHFETSAYRPLRAWIAGVNTHLPKTISVKWAKEVGSDFHARFSAQSRTYQYLIHNASVRSSFLINQVTLVNAKLDVEKMHQAGQDLLGEHDFSGFRASGCQSFSSHRNMMKIDIKRQGVFVLAEIQANAFLLHMVRNIMGVLIDIGIGVNPVSYAADVLASKDRTQASKTAPAAGLYLIGVEYPLHFNMLSSRSDLGFWSDRV